MCLWIEEEVQEVLWIEEEIKHYSFKISIF
jgi:hypothetical protein